MKVGVLGAGVMGVERGKLTREDADAALERMTDCFRWPAGPFGMVKGATEGWSG